MTVSRLRAVLVWLFGALFAASCVHVGERYDYTSIEKPYTWGGVRIGLAPKTSYYRDGVSMMKGPYSFVVAVWLNDGGALPPTCKARFQSATLLDPQGKAIANLPSRDVTPQVPLAGMPPRPHPDGLAYASLPFEILDIPHFDYLAMVDFQLDGCGAADGAYRVRDVIASRSEKRRFNPVWSALMGI